MRKNAVYFPAVTFIVCFFISIFSCGYVCEAAEIADKPPETDIENEQNVPVLEIREENGHAVLEWSNEGNADKYVVYRNSTENISEYSQKIYESDNTDITSYTDSAIVSDYYYYRVAAYFGEKCFLSNVVRYDRPVETVNAVKAEATEDGHIIFGFQESTDRPAGYEIYRSETGQEGSFSLAGSIEKTYGYYIYDWDIPDDEESFPEDCEFFRDYNVQYGYTYYYMVRAYDMRDGKVVYGRFSNIVSAQMLLGCVRSVRADSLSYHSVMIKWKPLDNANGYIIGRSLNEAGPYENIADITENTAAEYRDENLVCGVTYYYRIYGYTVLNGAKIPGMQGTAVDAKPMLGKVQGMSSKTKTPTRMTIKWKAVEGAHGYIVYKMNGNKKYKQMKKTTASDRTAKLKVRNGVAYNFKIVAYRTMADGSTSVGEETEFQAYGDYYGYEEEDFDSKYSRVYKKGRQYKSSGEARKHMTVIKVRVWDFKSGMSGPKITKTKYITCNKAIAPTLKKIFNKIYRGREKAPIYELGCYNWRSGQHGQGLAVDINSNYNAMYDGKKISAGKCWNPKKYAYSIKRNGDIERAFAEYGFPRGFWGSRRDYMHFSYFGT